MKSWEVPLGAICLLASPVVPGSHYTSLADLVVAFGCIVLGTGLLKDLWALLVTKPDHGEREVAMCVESIVGAFAVVGGLVVSLLLFFAPHALPGFGARTTWLLSWGSLWLFVGGCLIFSAWVHDLVIVRRGGKTRILRHPDHGSFVVHLFRGQAKSCALPPPNS